MYNLSLINTIDMEFELFSTLLLYKFYGWCSSVVRVFDFDARVHGFDSHWGENFLSLKIFLHHSGGRIARLFAVGDQVHESNDGTVFAQFRH